MSEGLVMVRACSRIAPLSLLWLAGAALAAEPPAAPAPPPPAPVAAPVTRVAVQSAVPLTQDACLDHTVKELGMSAKKAEGAGRRWDIAPKFLHSALAKDTGATLGVELEKTDKASLVHVRASWGGGPKDKGVQLEIEERLRLMATKMAQQCGVTKPELSCTTTPAGGTAAPCATPAPPAP